MPVYVPGPGARPPSVNIGPWSPDAIGQQLAYTASLVGPVSAAWPSANRGIGYPFMLTQPRTALRMWVYNGTTASGNLDAGIYDAAGNRLVRMGSTAQSGTSALQLLDIADTALPAYVPLYAFLAMDGTTGTAIGYTPSVNLGQARATGAVQAASAFSSGLVASLTYAALASSYVPLFGIAFVATL